MSDGETKNRNEILTYAALLQATAAASTTLAATSLTLEGRLAHTVSGGGATSATDAARTPVAVAPPQRTDVGESRVRVIQIAEIEDTGECGRHTQPQRQPNAQHVDVE